MNSQIRPIGLHFSPKPEPRWVPLAFAAAVLAAGMISAFAGFLLTDPAQSVQTLPTLLNLPPWFFWMVWIVIYPALGVAVWHVWRARGGRLALAFFGVYLVTNLAFLPLNALLPGVWTAFLLDLVGLFGGLVLAALFGRVSRASLGWLLPLLIWLPITTLNKVPAILVLMNGG